jgi:anti-anti-sigma factor
MEKKQESGATEAIAGNVDMTAKTMTDIDDSDEPYFRWSESFSEKALTLTLEGDLDLYSAPMLRGAMDAALPRMESRHWLVFDLRAVAFIDSAGLALLVETQRKLANKAEIGLVVEKGTQPDRVLYLGRFETFLKIARTPEELLATPAS